MRVFCDPLQECAKAYTRGDAQFLISASHTHGILGCVELAGPKNINIEHLFGVAVLSACWQQCGSYLLLAVTDL
jgi:hypothetical protein